jgi:TPR repeat protein
LVLEPPVQHVIATGEAGETEAKVADAPAGEAVATAKAAGRQDVSELIEQGKRFFEMGDLSAARILFTRAVKAGDAAAAVGMGMTYDPVALAGRGIRGVAADPDKARAWYERAKDMNSSGGPRRLEASANR